MTEYPHNKARLEQFSDGVFAIAITLLALDIGVPNLLSTNISDATRELLPLLPTILAFVLSFFTIAIFWVNHHQMTQTMGPIKHEILWLNVLVLLFVTLIPFATKVISTNPHHSLAVMTYSLVLFLGSVSFTVLRYFIHKSCGEQVVGGMNRSLVGPIVYGVAVITSFISIPIAYLFLVIPPLFYFLPKKARYE
jgi:uncharacterized membrane protein